MKDVAGMARIHACPRCGFLLESAGSDCPYCASQKDISTWPRERVLAVSAIALALLFVTAGYAARSYHRWTKRLAEKWCLRGGAELAAGRPNDAGKSLHNSYFYDPQNIPCQLELVRALMAGQHFTEARHHLQGVLAQDPGNGEASLELAELAASRGDYPAAVRHYHNAVYGVWPENDGGRRTKARLELVKFLLVHGANEEALGELMGLAANSPGGDPAVHLELGRLFLEAGSPTRALGEFRVAMRDGRGSAQTYAEAGDAAYEIGEYREAFGYLERAARDAKEKPEVEASLAALRSVINADPQVPGIGRRARLARMKTAYEFALARLNNCIASSPPSAPGRVQLDAVQARAGDLKKALKQPDRAPEVMEFVFDSEQASLLACGPPAGFDQTLLLLSRRSKVPKNE